MKIECLFIAEKPSLAEAIAHARAEQLGVTATKSDGFWQVGPDAICWFFGHMYELAEPKSYDERWAKWRIDDLPIAINDNDWKLEVSADKRPHMTKIGKMLKAAQTLVNAGDAAREGQLLVDEALVAHNINPFGSNVLRLWVQSMTRTDMLTALSDMKPNASKQTLYLSAVCRSRADWLHGMNYSRLYTLLARNSGADTALSVGRVQTPTLRLIVDRDNKRNAFKPVDHYGLKVGFSHPSGDFNASWSIPEASPGLDPEGRLLDRSTADSIVKTVSGQIGTVTAFQAEPKSKSAPLPYSLSALQAECGAKFGMQAKEVLDTAQALYERHRIASYPRSDSRHLPTAILTDEAPAILAALTGAPDYACAGQADKSIKSAAWNDAKVSDHHGIIPTAEFSAAKLAGLSETERQVFDLIARSFIVQFYPADEYQSVSASIACAGQAFEAAGTTVTASGWKFAFSDTEADDSASLPVLAIGDTVTVTAGEVVAKRTTPPAAFTDGTLIAAMSGVHKFVTDPAIKKRLKETSGIGTEATRADTIETLLKRRFVERKGKNGLQSTTLGKSLIAALPSGLTDPGVTALWEDQLAAIEKGEVTAEAFLAQQSASIAGHIEKARGTVVKLAGAPQRAPKSPPPAPIEGHGSACPACSEGTMQTRAVKAGKFKGQSFLGCSRFPDCKHSIWPKTPAKKRV